MAAAPLRSTLVCTLALLAGCLNNPKKPLSDDGGFDQVDGAPIVVPGDARVDLAATPDSSADLAPAPDVLTPVEPPPDGSVPQPEAGPPDTLAPDVNGCTPACAEGGTRCGPGGGVQTCVSVAGCPAWGPEKSCGDHASCDGSPPGSFCACKPAPSCNGAAGNFCKDATSVGTCAKDAFGCAYVTATTMACPSGQLCGGMAPNGACGCSNTCSAAQVGSYCIDNKTVATCTATNGCFASSGSMTCAGAQTCQGAAGSSACKCPANGTAEGTGCATAGATSCTGNTLLTCTTEAGSGCRLWVKTTDCAAAAGGPFQCGTRGGAAACQCPDTTTNIFVDPVAGHDTATVVPNGANTPAACRFKTITKALTAVTSTRRRVVAITANPPTTFNDETFPLVVPANVTLDTNDGTPTPANYTISFDSASATSAITMADGAILEGFTVQSATGNAAASTISCTAGAITVRNSVLVGATSGSAATKPATGIAIGTANTDTCLGTLTNLTIRNFRTAVSVRTAATMPVTITDSTLRDSGIGTTAGGGLVMNTGKVTATRLTINKSATGTASWGVVLDPTSTTVAPSLTATDLTIAGLGRAGLRLQAAGGMASPLATLTAGDVVAGSASDAGAHVQAGTLSLTGTNIHGAGADGVLLEGGVAVVGPGSKLEANGRDGLRALAGTLLLGASAGTAVSVATNTGLGVALLGTAGNLTSTLKNVAIHDNHDLGVLIQQGATFTTSTALDGNDIYANNTTAGKTYGGIFFATSSTLTSFTANKVHGNIGDELAFDAQPNGGDTWDLSGPVGCATPNQIYCYTSAPNMYVGVRILDTAPMNTKVNIASASWANPVPTKGTDFEFDMLKHDVTALPACAAIVATCN